MGQIEQLAMQLKEIDQRLQKLHDIELDPAKEKELWQKFHLEWNYNSNHIEGNTLTYVDTKLLLIRGKISGTHELREVQEMKAHDLAIKLVREWAIDQSRELSESDIRELNQIILVEPFYKKAITESGASVQKLITPGEYKSSPNHVLLSNGEIFKFAEVEEVAPKMAELIEWYRSSGQKLHPIVVAAVLHYRLVRIHPFDDGNGRVARLIMNFHLLKSGYPPAVIKSVDKSNYFLALQQADNGDELPFQLYIANEVVANLHYLEKAHQGQKIEEDKDWQKELDILSKKLSKHIKGN